MSNEPARHNLSDDEVAVLEALEGGGADVYDLAQALAAGPAHAQETVHRLVRDGLVDPEDGGRSFRRTRDGDLALRNHQGR